MRRESVLNYVTTIQIVKRGHWPYLTTLTTRINAGWRMVVCCKQKKFVWYQGKNAVSSMQSLFDPRGKFVLKNVFVRGFSNTRFFYKQWSFSAQAQMLLSEIQNPLKLVLPYQTKRCLKYYLGREQSFDKGFRVQFSKFSEIGFENW